MKVGLYLTGNPPTTGGEFTFEHEIYRSLLELGVETRHQFVVFGWDDDQNLSSSTDGIQHLVLARSTPRRVALKGLRIGAGVAKKFRHPTQPIHVQSRIEELISRNQIDLMWYLTPSCATLEVPYITTVWDLQHRLQPFFPEVSQLGIWENRERWISLTLRRATAIVSGTNVGKKEIQNFFSIPPQRITVVPQPTPSFALNAAETDSRYVLEKFHIPPNYLFYPAQFWSHKNHAGLLHAVRCLRSQYNQVVHVVFVGSDQGNLKHIEQLTCEFGLEEQVHFLGFVEQVDLVSLYRQASVLTFLSYFGPDNLPPLEAFALGCPVIASDVSGAREQLGDAAMLVNPANTEEIALAINSIHDSPSLRETLVTRGKIRAKSWTGKDYVRGVLSMLDEFEPIRRCWK